MFFKNMTAFKIEESFDTEKFTQNMNKMSGDTITAPPKSGCGTLILPHL